MTKATLVTQSDVLTLIEYAKLPVVEADIPDLLIDMVALDIEVWLSKSHISFSTITDLDDIRARGFLWGAHMCMLLEAMSMRAQIEQSSGDVAQSKVGNTETQFQRWQPMFFFAKGMAAGFYELLPHMTYQMKAMQLLRGWKTWYFRQTYPGEIPWGTVAANMDSRSNYVIYPANLESYDLLTIQQELDLSIDA